VLIRLRDRAHKVLIKGVPLSTGFACGTKYSSPRVGTRKADSDPLLPSDFKFYGRPVAGWPRTIDATAPHSTGGCKTILQPYRAKINLELHIWQLYNLAARGLPWRIILTYTGTYGQPGIAAPESVFP
jgi:hypothetical protein